MDYRAIGKAFDFCTEFAGERFELQLLFHTTRSACRKNPSGLSNTVEHEACLHFRNTRRNTSD